MSEVSGDFTPVEKCPGVLIWHDLDDGSGAVLECSACDYVIVTGTIHDQRHSGCEIMRGA